MRTTGLALMLTMMLAPAALAQGAPDPVRAAIAADPPRDAAHPARLEVLHIPSGGGMLNAIAYVAAGAGPQPTLILFHGLPGNEKNLDLAQAVRRAGWTVIAPNYRGSWGSPGAYSFAGDLVDGDAVIAYARDPANAAKLGIDPKRIAVAGHSLGGWVAAMTAAHDPQRLGTILISAANIGSVGRMPRAELVPFAADNRETLAATAEEMADELAANTAAFDWSQTARGLALRPLLVLTSDDGLAPGASALVASVRASKTVKVPVVHVGPDTQKLTIDEVHVATDHSWSDARIRLQTEIIRWLAALLLPPG